MSTANQSSRVGFLTQAADFAADMFFALKVHVSATDVARVVSVLSLGVVFGLVVSF